MSFDYRPKKTLSPKNQFRFICPIFGAEVAIASCFHLDNLFKMGQAPTVRQGCQACMRASKCPTYWIRRRMMREGSDPYHATEPTLGKLDHQDLEAIVRIVVPEGVVKQFNLSDKEEELVRRANENVGKIAPMVKVKSGPMPKPAKTNSPAIETSDDIDAAITGDMSAAITAAVENSGNV